LVSHANPAQDALSLFISDPTGLKDMERLGQLLGAPVQAMEYMAFGVPLVALDAGWIDYYEADTEEADDWADSHSGKLQMLVYAPRNGKGSLPPDGGSCPAQQCAEKLRRMRIAGEPTAGQHGWPPAQR
jgi:hypothetical protein